jgi:hypothetical protein
VLSFQHHNTYEFDLGIDVHPRLGLIAAAQDPSCSNTGIRLHNLWTGSLVKEVPLSPGSQFREEPRICCLKFEVDQGTDEVRSTALPGVSAPFVSFLLCRIYQWQSYSPRDLFTDLFRLLCGRIGEAA